MMGVTIGDKHTNRDWGLKWHSCAVSMPEAQSIEIQVPGRDGVIDLTETLTGEVRYKMRTITLSFVKFCGIAEWQTAYSAIAAYCHGKRMKVVLDTDAMYYYFGRVLVSAETKDNRSNNITLTIESDPYKYDVMDSCDEWEWDAFNFESGIIRSYNGIKIAGERQLTVVGTNKKTVPTITCSQPMTLMINNDVFELKKGDNRDSGIVINPGENKMIFQGEGTITIEFKGVCL